MTRAELIDRIILLLGDEATENTIVDIAKESKTQLVNRLADLAQWYYNEYNNLN